MAQAMLLPSPFVVKESWYDLGGDLFIQVNVSKTKKPEIVIKKSTQPSNVKGGRRVRARKMLALSVGQFRALNNLKENIIRDVQQESAGVGKRRKPKPTLRRQTAQTESVKEEPVQQTPLVEQLLLSSAASTFNHPLREESRAPDHRQEEMGCGAGVDPISEAMMTSDILTENLSEEDMKKFDMGLGLEEYLFGSPTDEPKKKKKKKNNNIKKKKNLDAAAAAAVKQEVQAKKCPCECCTFREGDI